MDHANMENFFGLLQSELLYLRELKSMDHFKRERENSIYHYKRMKVKRKGLPPVYNTENNPV
ncbi:IS3 family transposase [Niallia endozanthoxylica]|uniref:IS3 family transposase n=1 Tax=Niallia endozanthoxylica TaxID=2036016 RepID=A0A5J5HQ71_9BACI|nr:IS3 family transposase [Niallia endozanthoxylica]